MRILLLSLTVIGAIVVACAGNTEATYSQTGIVGNWLLTSIQTGNAPDSPVQVTGASIYRFGQDGSMSFQLVSNPSEYKGSYTYNGQELSMTASGNTTKMTATLGGDRLQLSTRSYGQTMVQTFTRKSNEELAGLLRR